MFRIPNYIAVWKNEIETSLKARLKFPKRKWINTSLFFNRRPETNFYKSINGPYAVGLPLASMAVIAAILKPS